MCNNTKPKAAQQQKNKLNTPSGSTKKSAIVRKPNKAFRCANTLMYFGCEQHVWGDKANASVCVCSSVRRREGAQNEKDLIPPVNILHITISNLGSEHRRGFHLGQLAS